MEPLKKFKTLADILAVEDQKHEDVWVPEWDCHVRIAVMSGYDRDTWEQQVAGMRDKKEQPRNIRASLISICMVDEAGVRLASTQEDVEKLGKKAATVLDKLFSVCLKVNKLREKDLKELEGN